MMSKHPLAQGFQQFKDLLHQAGLTTEVLEPVTADRLAMSMLTVIIVMPLASPPEDLEFTTRLEANALTAAAFRNGPLEDLHAQAQPFDDAAMKNLMISSSRRLHMLLRLREALNQTEEGQRYWRRWVLRYHTTYCRQWEITFDLEGLTSW